MKASSPKRASVKANGSGKASPVRGASPARVKLPTVRGTRVSVAAHSGPAVKAVASPEAAAPAASPIFADFDAAYAKSFVQPKGDELKDIVMYGELAQLTYDSFRNKAQGAKVLNTPRLGDPKFEQRFKDEAMGQLTQLLQPQSLAVKRGYKVIDFLYANSGWYFNDVERAFNDGIGKIIEAGKDPDERAARKFQEQYNWIGYVAVSDPGPDGKQDVAIVFRGTICSTEWVADLDAVLIPATPWAEGTTVDGGKNAADSAPVDPIKSKMPNPKAARICRGFKKMYAKPSEADPVNRRPPQVQIYEDMDDIFSPESKFAKDFNIGTITCTGHSLGAALATVAAYDLAHASCVPNDVKIRLCNFEGPKVGDEDFVANFNSLGIQVQRVANVRDVVASVPGLSPLALKQIAEAFKAAGKEAGKAAVGAGKGAIGLGDTSDPDNVHRSIKELLRDARNKVAIEVAEFVQDIAAWKHNPFMGPLLGSFFHVADPIALDTSHQRLKDIVKQPADLSGCHNLEMMLYMLDPSRDKCLINKGGDILKSAEKECINWWATSQDKLPPTCPKECHKGK